MANPAVSPVVDLAGVAMLRSNDRISVGLMTGDGSGTTVVDFAGQLCTLQLANVQGPTAFTLSNNALLAPSASRVGLGGRSNPLVTLDVIGSVGATGNVSACNLLLAGA